MAELEKFKPEGMCAPRVTRLCGSIVVGAAGVISGQSGIQVAGVTFAKNGTGRFDGTIHRGYKRVIDAGAAISSPTAGNIPVVTDGNLAYVNGIATTAYQGLTPTSTFTVFCNTSNGVATAADPKSGDVVNWWLELSDL